MAFFLGFAEYLQEVTQCSELGFFVASGVFLYVYDSLSAKDFLSWGWRFPFFTAFAINVVALFARLRLVVTHEYEKRMEEHELDPAHLHELLPAQGHHIVIGAFAALASYALFHLVTVFPLSWVNLFAEDRGVADFMKMELLGAAFAAAAMPMSGLIADKIGRRPLLLIGSAGMTLTLATMAVIFGTATWFSGNFDAMLHWWQQPADPEITLFFAADRTPPAGRNINYLDDRDLTALLYQSDRTVDQVQRALLLKRAQRRIAELVPELVLYNTEKVDAVPATLQGFRGNPTNTGPFWNVWEWEIAKP